MSNKIKETRKKIRQKIDAIKRAKDNAKEKSKKFVDGYENKALKGADDLSKTLSDFSAKKLKKLEGGINRASDVFSDLLETVEKFVSGKNIKVESSDKLFSKQRLRQLTNESAIETLKSSQQIILEAVQKILFAGDGICGTNQTFGLTDTTTLKPQEFDYEGFGNNVVLFSEKDKNVNAYKSAYWNPSIILLRDQNNFSFNTDKIKAANSYKISIKGYNELGKLINVETIIKN